MPAVKTKVIRKSWKYYKRVSPALIVAAVLMLLQALINLTMPHVPQLIIDRILNPALGGEPVYSANNLFSWAIAGYSTNDYFGMLLTLLLIMAANRILFYLFHYVRWNLSHHYTMQGLASMRQDAFRKLLRQSPMVLSAYTSGNMLTVINNDPDAVKEIYLHHIIVIFECVINVALAMFFLSRINPFLLLVPLVSGSTIGVIVVFYNKILRKKFDQIREGSIALSSCIQENINGVRIIRSYATESQELKKFADKNAAFRDNYISLARKTSKYAVIFRFIGESMGIASTVIGVILALNGKISIGEFTTFAAYTNTVNGCIIGLAIHLGNLQNCLIAGRRYFDFMDQPEPVNEPNVPQTVVGNPHFAFRGVGMEFEGKTVLKNIDIDLPYGKKLGIMGSTGAGKSLLFKLINRYFDCTEGEITLNGSDIRSYTTDTLRRQSAYVMQDVFLFSDTVRNNIAFYDESAPEEAVLRAADLSEAAEVIPRLSEGYETIVGERGLGLSGGQKQRISIARALLKDAPVILLDDCSSALDYETEKRIGEKFRTHLSEKTVIKISHRATSVMDCDEILFIENGEILERGTHEELMALSGAYCSVFREQESAREEEIE